MIIELIDKNVVNQFNVDLKIDSNIF